MEDWTLVLINLSSSLFILLFGWIIAWIMIHKNQRKNERQNKINLLINDIQELAFLTEETTFSMKQWLEYRDKERSRSDRHWYDKPDKDAMHKANTMAFKSLNKTEVIQAKFNNWFPKYNVKTIRETIEKEEESTYIEWNKKPIQEKGLMFVEWSFLEFIAISFEYNDLLLDCLENHEEMEKGIDKLDSLYEKVNHVITYILIFLVQIYSKPKLSSFRVFFSKLKYKIRKGKLTPSTAKN